MVDEHQNAAEEILRRLGELDQKIEYLIEAMHDFRYRKPPRLSNPGGREQ